MNSQALLKPYLDFPIFKLLGLTGVTNLSTEKRKAHFRMLHSNLWSFIFLFFLSFKTRESGTVQILLECCIDCNQIFFIPMSIISRELNYKHSWWFVAYFYSLWHRASPQVVYINQILHNYVVYSYLQIITWGPICNYQVTRVAYRK